MRYPTAFLGSSALAGSFQPGVAGARATPTASRWPTRCASSAAIPSAIARRARPRRPARLLRAAHRAGAGARAPRRAGRRRHHDHRPDPRRADFRGEAGHAGTVPMTDRRDALAAAAEWMLAAEALARGRPGLVATVGRIAVDPGARNVIPGEAWLSLDVRHTERRRAPRGGRRPARGGRADRRGPRGRAAAGTTRGETAAVPTSPELTERARRRGRGRRAAPRARCPAAPATTAWRWRPSPPIAMLFVRCERGISHNPAEAVAEADVAVALDVLERFVGDLA